MSLVKYHPITGFGSMFNAMNNLMNYSDRQAVYNKKRCGYVPRIDISEDDQHLYFQAEIPGMNKEDVSITVNDENVLTIKGERKRNEEENKTFHRSERYYGEFSRAFYLPDNVNADSIKAEYSAGLLNLEIEKVEPEKPKEIQVSIK